MSYPLMNLKYMDRDRYFGLSPRIAKWKDLSQFEGELSDYAETDLKARLLYAEYYRHLDPGYYDKGKEFARQMYESHGDDFRGTDFDEVYVDMVYCLHRYGLSFQDYCIYNLINKSERCRSQFVADKMRYHYCDILNAPDVQRIMTDKYECYKNYSPFYKRQVIPCLDPEGLPDFINFAATQKRFIYKPLLDHSGHGIQIFDTASIDIEKWYLETVEKCPGIVEELISQGDSMNRLNPGAVNSCRVVAFTTGDDVTIIGGALRMGVGKGVTDNAGSGGIYASIETDCGIIQSDAKNHLNQHFKFHPTTHTPIMGFKLPEWDKARQLIHQMSTHIEGTTLISWDIAYGVDGWCMVEANDNGAWGIMQSNLEVGRKEDLYALMDKYFAFKNNQEYLSKH